MKKNIFVIGLDRFNEEQINSVKGIQDYTIYGLLPYDMVVNPKSYDVDEMIETGIKEIEESGVKPDAIISHWDFPAAALLAVFRRHYGLPGPELSAVLMVEHKYWCRLRHEKTIASNIPAFESLNPFDSECIEKVKMEYPFWIKPNIAFSSQLAYYITSKEELGEAVEETKKKIWRFGEPFKRLQEMAELPSDIPAQIDGYRCILEKPIGGRQCTVEGYIKDGKINIYGIVDSITEGKYNSSFARYELPSHLPRDIQEKLGTLTEKAVHQMGIDDAPFNIEYFWDEKQDQIWLLEVNSRISKSHSPLFRDITGSSNHEVAIELALGDTPDYPRDDGAHDVSIKFMVRRYKDGVVTRVPTQEELETLEKRYPGTSIQVEVKKGQRLSEMLGQDSYSYEVAVIFMGGASKDELEKRYAAVLKELPLEFDKEEKLV